MPAKKTATKSAKSTKPSAAKAVRGKPVAKAVAKKTVSNTPKTPLKSEPTKPESTSPAKAAPAASKAPAPAKTPAPAKAPAAAKSPSASKSTAPATAAGPTPPAGKAKEVIATFVQRNPRPIAPPPDAEDGDEHNLLAGPRNVQPYIVKRGEQYMSREQLDHFRTILQSWKRDLMREVDRTVSHMKDEAANFPDPNDRATQEEEFSLELRTRDRERKLIRKIEEALERIEDGSYGYCLETGEEIGIKRLEARPVATLSLEAQERRERREKQYGDRDDRYR
jgi:DnaK suppressor protein